MMLVAAPVRHATDMLLRADDERARHAGEGGGEAAGAKAPPSSSRTPCPSLYPSPDGTPDRPPNVPKKDADASDAHLSPCRFTKP